MNSGLRASVVVPVRNRPDLLAQTLTTLVSQDFPPTAYEVVICDDGSTEDIASVIAKFSAERVSVRFHSQPPLGPAAARNLGIRISQAPIAIFVDSDVIADSALVRHLVEALDEHSDWKGAEAALHPTGLEEGILWDAPASKHGGHYHTAAIAYRREVLDLVGGFDEEFRLPACEDVELAACVLKYGAIGFVPEAKVWHPRRKVSALTHWRWRHHWRYETILAVRYGFLVFPGRSCGPFPRIRVGLGAVVTLPAGRFLAAMRVCARSPKDACVAASYAVFDVLCGLFVLPVILFSQIPSRQDYLHGPAPVVGSDA